MVGFNRLPDNVCDEDGAMVYPLAVAVHACEIAEMGIGCNVLVVGAGPIGLLIVAVCKAMGATNIMVVGKVTLSGVTSFVTFLHTVHTV